MPADWIRNTNGPALPSMIGTSEALRSTYRLSMPRPASADIKCSIVETRVPSSATSVVESAVSPTRLGSARISHTGVRSTRRNTMPVLTGAGRSVMTTFSPLCMPTPVALMTFFRVLCLITGLARSLTNPRDVSTGAASAPEMLRLLDTPDAGTVTRLTFWPGNAGRTRPSRRGPGEWPPAPADAPPGNDQSAWLRRKAGISRYSNSFCSASRCLCCSRPPPRGADLCSGSSSSLNTGRSSVPVRTICIGFSLR